MSPTHPLPLTFVLGGARSGKSAFAVRLAQARARQVCFIATAQPVDEEMAHRIARHRAERPPHWRTREIPRHLAQALRRHPPQAALCLVDCLSLLVANILLETVDPERPNAEAAQAAVAAELNGLLDYMATSSCSWIVVSNEVGMGIVPMHPLSRLYRDLLGWANQRLTATAQEVYYLLAGVPLPLHRWRADAPNATLPPPK